MRCEGGGEGIQRRHELDRFAQLGHQRDPAADRRCEGDEPPGLGHLTDGPRRPDLRYRGVHGRQAVDRHDRRADEQAGRAPEHPVEPLRGWQDGRGRDAQADWRHRHLPRPAHDAGSSRHRRARRRVPRRDDAGGRQGPGLRLSRHGSGQGG